MNSQFNIIYEIIDPVTRESFFTEDRYIAEYHYEEKSCDVYEHHITTTKLSSFTKARQDITLYWHEEDSKPLNKGDVQ
jgi:hypothetical protein